MSGRGGSIRRKVPTGKLTTSDFATAVGVSDDTVKRWRGAGSLTPSGGTMKFGSVKVYLYTEDDVRRGKELAIFFRQRGRHSPPPTLLAS